MPVDPQDGGLDAWFVPTSDGYPDDWFVPQSAATGVASRSAEGPGDTLLPEPIKCDGPSCTMGGSYGTSGMYSISGRNLCRNCAVKFLGIQDLPAAEQMMILQNFPRR
jgi:hypothetical protein